MIKGKYLLWGALGAAGLAGGAYLINLKRLSVELETEIKASIYKIKLTGITIRFDVRLKNPTGGTIKIKYPFVKIIYNDTTLGSSEAKDQDFEIPIYGERQIEPIYIDLGFISLATSAPALLKEYRSTGKMTLNAKAVTTLNNNIPYTKDSQIVLGKSQKA